MVVLDKLLTKLKANGSKVLLFSQFKMMLDVIEDYVTWRGYNFCRLDGDTSLDVRVDQMDDFNSPKSDKFIFLITTRAGGLGINLVGADAVIIFDSDWNPQSDLQAIDRAHRIGQKKQVRVFRLVTEHTVDEKLVERAEIKLRLDRIVIQQGRLSDPSAKILASHDTKAIIQHGMKYILASTESDIKDEDIDAILSRDAMKTAAHMKELDKMCEGDLKNYDYYQSISCFDFEGVDFRKLRDDSRALNSVRSTRNITRKVNKQDRELSFGSDEDSLEDASWQPPPKQLTPRPFHFLNPKLNELLIAEATRPLTGAEKEAKMGYLTEGFPEWRKADFEEFVDALQKFGRNGAADISRNVPGKTPSEVLRYHKVFIERGPSELPFFKDIMLGVNDNQTKKRVDDKEPIEPAMVKKRRSTAK